MIIISTEDFVKAESLFLPMGDLFSEEKRNILTCVESKDIVACPGSGKTTTLLAKLSIIGDRLNQLNGKGICVLTHTNIAMDEIKERLNVDSKKLFEYPNYFGTIQSFINQYVALPYFRNLYGKNAISIDDQMYVEEIRKRYRTLESGVKGGLLFKYRTVPNVIEYLCNIRFHPETDILIDRIGKPLYKSEGQTSRAIRELKNGIMQDGILTYDDAYILALKYMQKCGSNLRRFFSERFAFVFIDEMQDTSALQHDTLERLFDKEKVIMQRFGDPNQAIYDNSEEIAWDIEPEPLKITNSNRNSPIISKMITPFELYESGMNGNNKLTEITPKIIVFNNKSINNVLPKFGSLIFSNGLHLVGNKKFKAVGRIGRDNGDGKIKIPSYYHEYAPKKNVGRPKFLADFFNKAFIDPKGVCDVKTYRNAILSALLRMVSILGISTDKGTYFSKTTLLNKVKEHDQVLFERFQGKLMEWCLKVRKGEDVKEDFIYFSKEMITKIFGVGSFGNLTSFFEGAQSEIETNHSVLNIYNHDCDDRTSLNIEIDTIAGVKGETHTATLYLETCYYKYDVGILIDSFKGHKKAKRGKREEAALKNAYVAMSRPSHLLCVAAQKSSIEGHEEELIEAGWEIVEV